MPKHSKNSSAYKKLCSSICLHKAWSQIYENGLSSDSKDTRNEVREFKKNERTNIDRIYNQLRRKKFAFLNNKAVTVGRKKRPIVLAPVESRIVQRAILDVLQGEESIQKFLRSKGSYGAIKSFKDLEKGVPPAIIGVVEAIKSGATYYYKSDIKSFFTQISRVDVIKIIKETIKDEDFINILEDATNLEVSNINSLPIKHRKFFDFNKIGTPQGCCLSPLLGNILLYQFDQEMNKNGISCFRYLDDFMILGKGTKKVQQAFNLAIKILKPLGLEAYHIYDNSDKAMAGHTSQSLQFLGVEIIGRNIRPAKESRDRLLESIKKILHDSLSQNYTLTETKEQRENSFVQALYRINNKLLGWGNQYYFCNQKSIWGSLDAEVDKLLKEYFGKFFSKKDKVNKECKRRMLGIHLISESKNDPIVW